ncbi:MAG TPA: hypothetical protein DEA32_00215, partial [Firmicutes bacterium]|nr:hypothetical protein [Bacillota bacterium]
SKEAESGRIVPDVAILTPQLFKPFTKAIDTKKVQRVIFDEGDMILFDGFLDEMEQACQMIPNARKSFFSASLGSQWLTRVKRMCHAEEIIDISQGRINGANIRHILVDLRGAKRSEGLLKLLSAPEVADGRTIVFVSRREELKQVAYDLKRAHVRFETISGELDKRGISKVISGFVDGDFQVLLATDFASRGLDLPEVKSVISYTLPIDQGYYFHRAGRSGRFDAPGTSYVLCGKEDLTECRALQRKGAGFTFMAVKKDGVSSVKSAPVSHLNQIKGENSYLTKAIVEAKRRYPLGHVKPGYKKKIKTAIRVAKSKHKKKILRTNLGKKDLTHGV